MELLSAVILKFEEALIVEYAELLFVALWLTTNRRNVVKWLYNLSRIYGHD